MGTCINTVIVCNTECQNFLVQLVVYSVLQFMSYTRIFGVSFLAIFQSCRIIGYRITHQLTSGVALVLDVL